jgi:hypothetical protein
MLRHCQRLLCCCFATLVVSGTAYIVLLDGGADDENAVMETIKHSADPQNNDDQIGVNGTKHTLQHV